jgi:hypothetical protein
MIRKGSNSVYERQVWDDVEFYLLNCQSVSIEEITFLFPEYSQMEIESALQILTLAGKAQFSPKDKTWAWIGLTLR